MSSFNQRKILIKKPTGFWPQKTQFFFHRKTKCLKNKIFPYGKVPWGSCALFGCFGSVFSMGQTIQSEFISRDALWVIIPMMHAFSHQKARACWTSVWPENLADKGLEVCDIWTSAPMWNLNSISKMSCFGSWLKCFKVCFSAKIFQFVAKNFLQRIHSFQTVLNILVPF